MKNNIHFWSYYSQFLL